MQRFIDILKEEEEKFLSLKTSYGRNDLKLLLEAAKSKAIIKWYEEAAERRQRNIDKQ